MSSLGTPPFMATAMDRNYLRDNLLDDEDPPPEFTRSPPRQVRASSRRSSKRKVPLRNSATSSETVATLNSAADHRESVFQPPIQSDRQFGPQQDVYQPEEASRNPFRPQNQDASPYAPPVQVVPVQQGDTGRTSRGKRLVVAIDYGTTYTGITSLR